MNNWRLAIIVASASSAIVAIVSFLWWGARALEAGCDARWRGEIARVSATVQAEVAKKGEEVLLNDAALIAALEEDNAKRKEAEANLEAAKRQLSGRNDGCPRVPARCLRP